jgi:membrane associated rhomboid family serine protease
MNTMGSSAGDAPPSSPWRRLPPVTTVVMILACIVFVIQCVYEVNNKRFNLNPERILRSHQFYRLVSSSWLHRNYQHLGMNLLSAYCTGPALERKLGSRKLVETTLFSVLLTPLLYVILAPLYNSLAQVPLKSTKGLSGIMFHWIAIECHLDSKSDASLFGMVNVPSAWYPWVLTGVLYSVDPRSSWLIHVSGILTGILQCYLWPAKNKLDGSTDQKMDPASVREARLRRFEESKNVRPWPTMLLSLIGWFVCVVVLGYCVISFASSGNLSLKQNEEL